MEIWVSNTSFSLGANETNFSNVSSHYQPCTGSYNTTMAVLDILMVVINLPITFYVIVGLFLRQFWALPSPRNSSSFSMSELFLLHLCCIHSFYYIGVLLTTIRNLGGVTGIRQEYLTAFHSSSLTGGASFFAAMSIDLYMAVTHPMAYIACRTSTKRKMAHTCCTFIWVYAFTVGIIIVVLNFSMYHPITMGLFCITLPISLSCFLFSLIALNSAGPGNVSKTSKLEKTKQNAVRYIMYSFVILIAYYLPTVCLFIYKLVKQTDWESLPCLALPLVITIQISELVAPLVFFYITGKLEAITKHCSTLFQNGLDLC